MSGRRENARFPSSDSPTRDALEVGQHLTPVRDRLLGQHPIAGLGRLEWQHALRVRLASRARPLQACAEALEAQGPAVRVRAVRHHFLFSWYAWAERVPGTTRSAARSSARRAAICARRRRRSSTWYFAAPSSAARRSGTVRRVGSVCPCEPPSKSSE